MGCLHEELCPDLVGVIEVFLGKSGDTCNVVYAELILVFLEEGKQVLINYTLGEQLKHLQIGMVGVVETRVHKGGIVDRSDLIKQVKSNLSCLYRLLSSTDQILHAEDIGLVEVHDTQVVEAAENIIVNLVLHVALSRVKGIPPSEF